MWRSEDSWQESFLNWGGGSSLAPSHVIQAGRPVSFQAALPVSAFLALWEFWHYRCTPLFRLFLWVFRVAWPAPLPAEPPPQRILLFKVRVRVVASDSTGHEQDLQLSPSHWHRCPQSLGEAELCSNPCPPPWGVLRGGSAWQVQSGSDRGALAGKALI